MQLKPCSFQHVMFLSVEVFVCVCMWPSGSLRLWRAVVWQVKAGTTLARNPGHLSKPQVKEEPGGGALSLSKENLLIKSGKPLSCDSFFCSNHGH